MGAEIGSWGCVADRRSGVWECVWGGDGGVRGIRGGVGRGKRARTAIGDPGNRKSDRMGISRNPRELLHRSTGQKFKVFHQSWSS